MTIINNSGWFYFILLCCLLFISCEKVDIEFGTSSTDTDPNITYYENYGVTIATAKADSFLTSGNSIFCIGNHTDPVFGKVTAGSYVQLSLPAYNPVVNSTVLFDSLELVIKPNGQFYGDSSLPVTVNVFRLTTPIEDKVNGDSYYNTSSFSYNPVSIGQKSISLYGKSGTAVHIKLSAALGQELLEKFRASDYDVSAADNFINYFKGLYISTDTVNTQSLFYFAAHTDSMLVQLHYHENSLFTEDKQLNFGFTSAKQFSNISFRHTNTAFSAFVQNKKQLIASASSGNQSFLNASLGTSIKITFPGLLDLKETHPYVKVVKAILIVKPDSASYAYPYQLPKSLYLYQTDATNTPGTGIYYTGTSSSSLQNGDLITDPLYGENTYYSYDITNFINTKISEGQFSQSALLLYSSLGSFDSGVQRLILNDQTKSRSVQLKLYVLGL